MRILKFNSFINESILLDLKDNVDNNLINKIESLVSTNASILEISCGNGSDSLYLKNKGYNVTCTEWDDNYVDNAKNIGLNCIKHDTSKSFPFKSKQFDLTYSRLGLHYFTKEQLENIFNELNRITKKYLVFTVKLVDDIPTGKVILSKEEWEDIVSKKFTIISSEKKSGILYNNQSNWLEIVAKVN